jgi:beta-barrel assembly-enhancing protease
MKHWIALAGILLLGVAAIMVSERRKVDVPVGPAAVLYLIADTEQELTRMPVSFTHVPEEEEIAIGNELAHSYESAGRTTQDTDTFDIEHYLAQVGSQLSSRAHRKLPYHFHYLADRYLINAFALPGGHVYVGAGLLALMDSEDELAAVLGHEIEHIDHYHSIERVQQEQALRRIPLGGLVELPIEIFEAGYSKDQELEADREGTRLAVQAGYSATGALRMFETFGRLYDEYHVRARTPQGELSELARQTVEGYFRSHPLPSERIAQVQRLIASQGWAAHAERDLAVAYVFLGEKAASALEGGKYAQARRLAMRSLELKPGRKSALQILAQAQFAQADFSTAEASYRKLLEIDPSDRDFANFFALALAASNRQTAASEFRRSIGAIRGEKSPDLQVQAAGLELLAGHGEPARDAVAVAKANLTEGWAPRWFADLAWWYYLAGNSETALQMVGDAVQQRPGDLRYSTEQAWIQIENHRMADAIGTLNSVYENTNPSADRTMAYAAAWWQARQPDTALRLFQLAVARQPEWENPAWVRALYSPLVVRTIQEMEAERERRKKVQASISR